MIQQNVVDKSQKSDNDTRDVGPTWTGIEKRPFTSSRRLTNAVAVNKLLHLNFCRHRKSAGVFFFFLDRKQPDVCLTFNLGAHFSTATKFTLLILIIYLLFNITKHAASDLGLSATCWFYL